MTEEVFTSRRRGGEMKGIIEALAIDDEHGREYNNGLVNGAIIACEHLMDKYGDNYSNVSSNQRKLYVYCLAELRNLREKLNEILENK
jgi:hypothetical protein